ncbi:MAG: leucine-rich repeat domain-containing protein [Bacteroidia bacterium]
MDTRNLIFGVVCMCIYLLGTFACQPATKKMEMSESDEAVVLGILEAKGCENARIRFRKVNNRIMLLSITEAVIPKFPTQLKELDSLISLYLNGNSIQDVAGIDSLTTLYSLGLSSNQIKTIPPLSHLTSLKSLNLNGNRLKGNLDCKDLPASLDLLYIGANQVSSIQNLSRLQKLEFLSLAQNRLSEFPDGICELSRIERLDARRNEFKDERIDISCLSCLLFLEIDSVYEDRIIFSDPTSVNSGEFYMF